MHISLKWSTWGHWASDLLPFLTHLHSDVLLMHWRRAHIVLSYFYRDPPGSAWPLFRGNTAPLFFMAPALSARPSLCDRGRASSAASRLAPGWQRAAAVPRASSHPSVSFPPTDLLRLHRLASSRFQTRPSASSTATRRASTPGTRLATRSSLSSFRPLTRPCSTSARARPRTATRERSSWCASPRGRWDAPTGSAHSPAELSECTS